VLREMFSRRWIVATLLVLVATAVMIRLGYWQLDRLEQRRAFNQRVTAQIEGEAIDLNQAFLQGESARLAGEITSMEYRRVRAVGEYDPSQEVILLNQAWNNQLGVRLLTPLHLMESEQVILVDRGWVPYEDYRSGDLEKYREVGTVAVEGIIRSSQSRPDIGTRTDPTPGPHQDRLEAFYLANVERIAVQVPYNLLPVYLQQAEAPGWQGPPHRSAPLPEITEGSHLGYAIQWFAFAAILFSGYPFFVRRETVSKATG
jgi:surfeit locus 1 family protein